MAKGRDPSIHMILSKRYRWHSRRARHKHAADSDEQCAANACGAQTLAQEQGAGEHRKDETHANERIGQRQGSTAKNEQPRAEERRVGTESVSKCRTRWSP